MQNKIIRAISFSPDTKPTNLDSFSREVAFNINLKRQDNGDTFYKYVVFQANLQQEELTPGVFFEEVRPNSNLLRHTSSVSVPPLPGGQKRNNNAVPYLSGEANTGLRTTSFDPSDYPYFSDYTWEMWFRLEGLPIFSNSVTNIVSYAFFSRWSTSSYTDNSYSIELEYYSNIYYITFRYRTNKGDTFNIIRIPWIPTTQTWHHIAVVIHNIYTLKIFIDGTQIGTDQTLIDKIITLTDEYLYIGLIPHSTIGYSNFKGYMSDIRLTRAARYTSNFTPPQSLPSSSLYLSDDINGACLDYLVYADYDSGPIKNVGGGPFGNDSFRFEQNGGLTFNYNYAYDVFSGSSPFTIECWTKLSADQISTSSLGHVIFSLGSASSGTSNSVFFVMNDNFGYPTYYTGDFKLIWKNQFGYYNSIKYPYSILKGVWYHVALCRETENGPIKLYVNGTRVNSITDSINNKLFNINTTYTNKIGTNGTRADGDLFGEVSELRMTRECRYYESFSVPTAPFSSGDPYYDYNVLLLHFDDGPLENVNTTYLDSATPPHSITYQSGTPVSLIDISTPTGKNATALFGEKTGQYIYAGTSTDFAFGTNDFTIEFYLYFRRSSAELASPSNRNIVSNHSSDADAGFKIYQNTTDNLVFHTSNADRVSSSSPLKKRTWYHIAIVRAGGVITLYVDGVANSPTSSYSSSITCPTNLTFGANSNAFGGCLDEFRLTRNFARYTGNFTPSTSPLPDTPATDDHYSDVGLLLHFSRGYNYTNSASIVMPFSCQGVSSLSTTDPKFGNYCIRFYGNGTIYASHLDSQNLPGSFTIEGWFKPESVTGTQILLTKGEDGTSTTYPAYTIKLVGTDIKFSAYSANNAGNAIFNSVTFGTGVALDTWHHFAVTRIGSSWTGFLNGVPTSIGTSALTPWNSNTKSLSIGGDCSRTLATCYNGYLDEIRITKGLSRYSIDFSGSLQSSAFVNWGWGELYPTQQVLRMKFIGPIVTTEDTGRAISSSGNASLSTTQFKWGGASLYLDGSANTYLSAPSATDLAFGSSDFTIEFWVYASGSFTNQNTIFDCRSVAGDSGYQVYIATDGTVRFYSSGADIVTSAALTLNQWAHIAIVRTSGVMAIYKDGTLSQGGVSYASSITCPGTFYMGRLYDNTLLLTGYLDDIRVYNGFARYLINFPAPTSIVGAVMEGDAFYRATTVAVRGIGENTGTTGCLEDLSFNRYWNKVNASPSNARTSTAQSKFGSSSILNTGTSAIYFFEEESSCDAHKGDFTVEGWIYTTTTNTEMGILSVAGNSYSGYYFYKNSSNKISCNLGKWSAFNTPMTSSGNISISNTTWYHVAITKKGLTIRIFVNGVLDTTTTLPEYPAPHIGTRLWIGQKFSQGSSSLYWSGHLQDIRYTKACKYTATFSPPSMFYSNIANNHPLVIHFEGADESTTFIDERGHAITASGSAVISTDAYHFGSSSGYFPGTSGVIDVTNNLQDFAFAEQEFNIEFWLKTNSSPTGGYVYFQDHNPNYIWVRFGSSGDNSLEVCVGNPDTDIYTSATVAHADFYSGFKHILISKKNNSSFGFFKVYIDGVYDGQHSINGDLLTKECTKLLLHMNGTDNSTTIVDNSYFTKPVTVLGSAKLKTTAITPKFGTASAYFDGTANCYLTVHSLPDFDFGLKDFTIECWIYVSSHSAANRNIFTRQGATSSTLGLQLRLGTTNKLEAVFRDSVSQTVTTIVGTTTVPTGQWNHCAIVRKTQIATLYLNGAAEGIPYCIAYNLNGLTTPAIGAYYDGTASAYFTGYIDELRVINGIAAYSGNSFTPPAAEFSNQDTDITFGIPNALKIGGNGTSGIVGYIDEFRITKGPLPYSESISIPTDVFPTVEPDVTDSGDLQIKPKISGAFVTAPVTQKFSTKCLFFDGTTNCYLEYKRNPYDYFGNKDFTVEFWVYKIAHPTATASYFYSSNSYFTANTFYLYSNNSNQLYLYSASFGTVSLGVTVPHNSWTHFAICRNLSTLYVFMNGVLIKTSAFANSGDFICDSSLWDVIRVGSTGQGTGFIGFIDGLLVVKGHAKYISPFTPSTSPISYYSVNFYNSFIDNLFSSKLLAYYEMNDSDVSEQLEELNGNYNLTTTGTITPQQTSIVPYNLEGKNNYSINFNGGSASGNFPNFSGSKSFSIQFYIKTSATTGSIIHKPGCYSVILQDGKIKFTITTSVGNEIVLSNSSVNDNISHLILIEYLGNNIILSIDGNIDNYYYSSFVVEYYKFTEDFFTTRDNYLDTQVLAQLRCNDLNNDIPGMFVLVFGTPTIFSTASPFGGSCLFFDGSCHLEIPKLNFSDSRYTTSYVGNQAPVSCFDFTIEMWVNITATPTALVPIMGSGAPFSNNATIGGGLGLYTHTDRKITFYAGAAYPSGSYYHCGYLIRTVSTLTVGQWYHVALVVKDLTASIFIDGIKQTLEFQDANWTNNSLSGLLIFNPFNFNIGSLRYHQGGNIPGETTTYLASNLMLDDIKISKGAVYTSNFSVPVAEIPTITSSGMQSTTNLTIQPHGTLISYGSGKINNTNLMFNGTTDYLVFADPILADTFTIDFWIYWFDISTQQVFLSQIIGSNDANTSFGVDNGHLYIDNGIQGVQTGTSTLSSGIWYHIAIVRNGTTCSCYLNGTIEVTHSTFQEPVRTQTQFGALNATLLINALVDAIRVRTAAIWSNNFNSPTRSDYLSDPYFDLVSILLVNDSAASQADAYSHYVGFQAKLTGEDSSRVFLEDTIYPSFTTTSANTKVTTTHFKHNLPSIAFNGINDAIILTNNTGIAFGTTFTFEFWVYFLNVTTKQTLFDKREATNNTGIWCYIDTDSKLYFNAGDSSDGFDVTLASGVLTKSTWYHAAITRNASDTNSWKLFINGTQSGATVNSAITIADDADLIVGKTIDNTQYFLGNLSEVQLTTSAKYTTNFTAPTVIASNPMAQENDYTSLLLHFEGSNGDKFTTDSSRYNNTLSFIKYDQISSAQYKLGSTSFLSGLRPQVGCSIIPYGEHLNLSGGDFTIEFFVYCVSNQSSNTNIMGMWCSTTTSVNQRHGPNWAIDWTSGNLIIFWWMQSAGGSGAILTSSSTSIGAWHHIAITRKGSVFSLWKDGALDATTTLVTDFRMGSTIREPSYKLLGLTFGNAYDNNTPYPYPSGNINYNFYGYLDELRILKGKSAFNSPFTPPASAYSLSTNYPVRDSSVKLFLDLDDYTILDKSSNRSKFTLEGGILAETIIGGSSTYFYSTGQALRATVGDIAFDTQDFTIESWINPLAASHGQDWARILESQACCTTWGGWSLLVYNQDNPSRIVFRDSHGSGGSIQNLVSYGTVPHGSWSHVAVTRNSGYYTLYINGIPQIGSFGDTGFNLSRSHTSYTQPTGDSKNTTCTSSSGGAVTYNPINPQSSVGIYMEFTLGAYSTLWTIGLVNAYNYSISTNPPGYYSDSWGIRGTNGNKVTNNSFTAYGSAFTDNCIIMMAIKYGKVWWGKDGTWFASGDPVNGLNEAFSGLTGNNGMLWPTVYGASAAGSRIIIIRTFANEFTYAIPKGFVGIKDAVTTSFIKTSLSIGNDPGSAVASFNGYMSDVRVTKGISRYALSQSEFVIATDDYASNVTLLLNCNGSNNGTTFTDSSTANTKFMTVNGSTVTSTGNKKFGTASAYFDGTGGYLETNDSGDWDYGTGDFTLEMWYQFLIPPSGAYNASGAQILFIQLVDSDNYIGLFASKTGFTFEVKSSGVVLVSLSGIVYQDSSRWHHLAVTRSVNTFTLWLDGAILAVTSTWITLPNLAASVIFGYLPGGTSYFTGWLDDIRLTKGVSRYSPVLGTTLLSHFNGTQGSTTFIDELSHTMTGYGSSIISTAQSVFGSSGSLYQDGSNGSYVSIPNSSDFQFGVSGSPAVIGNFTIESWVYMISLPTSGNHYGIMSLWDYSTNNMGWFLTVYQGDQVQFGYTTNGSTVTATNFAFTFSTSTWYHIALSSKDGVIKVFVNGTQVGSNLTPGALFYNSTSLLCLGGFRKTSATYTCAINGYIDEARITKGCARYTTNFTKPAAEFIYTATPLNEFSYAKPRALPPIPNPQYKQIPGNPANAIGIQTNKSIIKFTPSFYTGVPFGPDAGGNNQLSKYFEFLKFNSATMMNYHDFTIEGWFLPNQSPAATGSRYWYAKNYNAALGIGLGVSQNSVDFYSNAVRLNASVNITDWAHIAFVRYGTLRRIYVNGTKVAEDSTVYSNLIDVAYNTQIGSVTDSIGSDANRYYGYIDGVRVSRFARYTDSTSFSPPAEQFSRKYEAFGNTKYMIHFDNKTFPHPSVFKIGNPKINYVPIGLPGVSSTPGSMYFTGDMSYVFLHEGNSITSEDLTIEFWVQPMSYGSAYSSIGWTYVWSMMNSTSDTLGIGILSMSDKLYLFLGNNYYLLDTFPLFSWTHIAITRDSGYIKVFVNGVLKYENSNFPSFSGAQSTLGLLINDHNVSANINRFHGFIKNFRVLKNKVLYTTAFSPNSTLSEQPSDNSPSIIDPDNEITIGNFIGNLDEIMFSTAAISSFVNREPDNYLGIYDQANLNYLYEKNLEYDTVPATDIGKISSPFYSNHFGTGKIWGTTKDQNGNAISRRVTLSEFGNGTPLESVWSDPVTGYYEFTELDTDSEFTVIAEDNFNYDFNDVIRAKVKAE